MTTTEQPDARRTDRYEAPAYLARYQQRRAARTDDPAQPGQEHGHNGSSQDPPAADAGGTPLYLRRFRARTGQQPVLAPPARPATAPTDLAPAPPAPPPVSPASLASSDLSPAGLAPADLSPAGLASADLSPAGLAPAELAPSPAAFPAGISPDLVTYDGETFTPQLAEVSRGKEIAAPMARKAGERIVAEISIIRHGITQGYSGDAGLTPMGAWQAHRRGHELARRVSNGEQVRIVCAATNRARQTAGQLYRGVTDGLVMFGITAEVTEPEAIPELRNFGVWTPDGVRDITSAFRQYQSAMERFERMAIGDRPRWMVEIDRFYRLQFGGADPIQAWLGVPMMYFESPQACVRRFWRGISRLVEQTPGTRILAATHSGPMRAFATWAHGYDPGEPLNTEEVRVKIRSGGRTALVSYRNRVTEVHIPPSDEVPDWGA